MIDVVHTTVGDWTNYLESNGQMMLYKCAKCKGRSGRLKVRNVTEATGGAHKEFKIVCEVCKNHSGVFWSKVLAERTWEAQSDPYYEDTTLRRKKFG